MLSAVSTQGKPSILRALLSSCAIAMASAIPATSASAQATAGADASPQSGLDEVIVTAQKRSQDVQAIPTSISVLTGYALKQQQIASYDDITRAVPGVSFSAGGSPGLNFLEMRGVSSTSGAATVGIYLDEVPLNVRNSSYDGNTELKLFDIDRVEVLRGPQGTLYGASSMGGTIRFIPNAPDLENFGGEVTLGLGGTYHGGLNYASEAVVNVPVVQDRLAVRAGISWSDDSGYINNLSYFTLKPQISGTNDERPLVGRIAALYELSDDWSATGAIFFQRDNLADNFDFYPALGLWNQNKQTREGSHDSVAVPSLTIKGDLGFAQLTTVTSYFWRQYNRETDGQYFGSYALAHFYLDYAYPDKTAQNDAIIGNLPGPSTYEITHHQVTQEVRLASPDDNNSPIRWVGGLYYSTYWDERDDYGSSPGLGAAFEDIYGFGIENSVFGNGPGGPAEFPDDMTYMERARDNEQDYAVFGQLELDLLPTLHAAIGARYQYARSQELFKASYFYAIGNSAPFDSVSKDYAFTPKFSLTYDVAEKSTIYTTISKGFRNGGPTGPDPSGPGNICAGDYGSFGIKNPPTTYGPDSLWNYEIGTKSRLLDNTLSVNISGYYIDWKNIQQNIYLPTCGFNFTTNVGSAEIFGTEWELLYQPVAALKLGLNGSLERAQITSSRNPQTVPVDSKIIFVPDWTLDMSAEYSYPITDVYLGFVRADYDYTGPSHGSYQVTNPNYKDRSYGVLNGTIGLEWDSWTATLFAKNLTNDHKIIQEPQINSVYGGYTVRPLTYGASVKKTF
jgi:outer membrane receptor protein involved in Fe transport